MSISVVNLQRCCAELKLPNMRKKETLCTLIEDELDNLTVAQLKACLKIFGLNTQGLKQELCQRLSDAVHNSNSARREREDTSAKREREENDKFIECHICMETMSPPIYQCHAGHLICEDCFPTLDACPTCRKKLNKQSPIRCRVSEALAATLTVSCPFPGCGHTTTADKIKEHKGSCLSRPLACPKCNRKEATPADLANHFNTVHGVPTKQLQAYTYRETYTCKEETKGGEEWNALFQTPSGAYTWFQMRVNASRHLDVSHLLQFTHRRSIGSLTVHCGAHGFNYQGRLQRIGSFPFPLVQVGCSPRFTSKELTEEGIQVVFQFPTDP
eukprot:TRINITY_DN66845_c4_g6_i1.p1 TRINITY_DN66845_c4_g6~~TRINITY_DN66845_c4_g6_i1.p1  ORF type:complete len:338 (-),score=9.39 TRINITY_DN66845_c4_g6_i1:272-1258(-)